jgi:DHA1 family inner membrane transport protein
VGSSSVWFALAVLTSVTFAVGFGELVIAGIVPVVARAVGVSIGTAGLLTTVYALVFAVLSPILATLFRGARRQRGLIAGLLVVAGANAFAYLGATFADVIVARVVAAAGSALCSPLALASIDDVVPLALRGRAQGIVFAGFGAALTLSLPIATLMASAFGWRSVFVVAGVLPLVAAFLASRLHGRENAPASFDLGTAAAAQTPWSAAFTPTVIRLLGISVFMLVGQYAVVTYIRPLLGSRGITDVATTALLLFLMGVFGIAGNLAGGVCVDRFGIRTTMLVSIGANIAIYVAMRSVAGPLALTIVLLALWNLASWAYSPAINGALAAVGGDARDTALALNMTAFNIGIAAGPALGGVVIDTSSIANVLVLGTAMLIVAFALALPRVSRSAG